MNIVYNNNVGLECKKYGIIYRRKRGILIKINESGNV